MSSVFALYIPACVDAAELSGLLASPEFLGAWEADGSLVLYWNAKEAEILQQVYAAVGSLGGEISRDSLRFHPVVVQDWNATWAASVQPIRIGRRIGIRPSWTVMDLPESGVELIIDPKQAFGTGHHATTRLLLEWLEEVVWTPGMHVLDVGTGSGILAMVALRLGATRALGIDVDATALDCARDYAAMNHFTDELELRCCSPDLLPVQSFDMILANLDRKTNLQVYREFSRLRGPQTQLVLSGLLEEDEGEMVRICKKEGWIPRDVRRSEGWIAIQLETASPASPSSG